MNYIILYSIRLNYNITLHYIEFNLLYNYINYIVLHYIYYILLLCYVKFKTSTNHTFIPRRYYIFCLFWQGLFKLDLHPYMQPRLSLCIWGWSNWLIMKLVTSKAIPTSLLIMLTLTKEVLPLETLCTGCAGKMKKEDVVEKTIDGPCNSMWVKKKLSKT